MDAAERRATVLKAIVEEYVTTAQPVASQTIASSRVAGRLERHGPQRHDPARAGRVHRPAPHLGRPDPHGPGLPLLRRPLHERRVAPRQPAAGRRRLLRLRAQRPRGPAARDQPAPREDHQPRGGRGRPAVRRGPRAPRPARRAATRAGARGRGALERLGREGSRRPRGDGGPDRAGRTRRRHRARWVQRSPVRRLPPRPATRSRISSPPTCSTRSPGASHPEASRSTSAARAASPPSRTRSPPRRAPRACSDARGAGGGRLASSGICSTRASTCRSAPRTTSTSSATARSCSRPYAVEGQVAGTVGVLGPTRMDYQQALAAVAAVSQQLGRLLLP